MSTVVMGIIEQIQPEMSLFAEKSHPERLQVALEGGGTIALGASLGDVRLRTLLNELYEKRVPVAFYLGENGANQLVIVKEWVVKKIADYQDAVEIEFVISHAPHILLRDNPRFNAILETLRRSEQLGTSVLVAEDDDHHILQVRAGDDRQRSYAPIEDLIAPDSASPTSVTSDQAQALFLSMQRGDCDVSNVAAPCIPFDYPDDGCWGRAHEMCRLITAAGVIPGKIWNYGRLTAATSNNPKCAVQWVWHVAPTLTVAAPGGATATVVVDPSLFDRVVSVDDWHAIQGDAAAQLAPSSWEIFHRSADGASITDPTFDQTMRVLETYRLALKARIAQSGVPPYAQCQLP